MWLLTLLDQVESSGNSMPSKEWDGNNLVRSRQSDHPVKIPNNNIRMLQQKKENKLIHIMRLTFQCPIDTEGRGPELMFDPEGTGTSNFCPSSIPPMGTVTVMACPLACASNVYPCSQHTIEHTEGNNFMSTWWQHRLILWKIDSSSPLAK